MSYIKARLLETLEDQGLVEDGSRCEEFYKKEILRDSLTKMENLFQPE